MVSIPGRLLQSRRNWPCLNVLVFFVNIWKWTYMFKKNSSLPYRDIFSLTFHIFPSLIDQTSLIINLMCHINKNQIHLHSAGRL